MEQPKLVPSEKIATKQKTLHEKLKERQSKVLVIAFCGPVSSGIPSVVKQVAEVLSAFNYKTETIKVSEFIKKFIKRTSVEIEPEELEKDNAKRIIALQDAGNELRQEYGFDVLSQFAITEIGVRRHKLIYNDDLSKKGEVVKDTPHRIAFLIDSIKHPHEINLLRTVYGHMFYMVGILCAEPIRVKNLKSKGFSETEASDVIERDKQQDEDYGQKLVKALQYADFFIRNNHPNVEGLTKQIKRYFDLIFGSKVITPTRDEYAMYVAQSAAFRSACISRQIGASILNKDGEIVATGCNDVPCYGGGLYTTECGDKDQRCAYLQDSVCRNDDYKKKLISKIKELVKDDVRPGISIDAVVNKVYEKTWLKDVVEFSRAVHAEMAALVSAARNGYTVKGSVLYTITFPCHNCARHIIASGIKKVVYIEPYEKSQALELHSDSIDLEPLDEQSKKVVFIHFEGVAPRQYLNLFKAPTKRKKDGRLVMLEREEALPVVPEYLDTFVDYESQITENLKTLGLV